MFKTNQNKSERFVRLIICLLIIPTPFIICVSNYSSILVSTLLFNFISGTCVIYKILKPVILIKDLNHS